MNPEVHISYPLCVLPAPSASRLHTHRWQAALVSSQPTTWCRLKRQPEWPMAAPPQGLWKTHPNHPGSCLPCGVTGVRAETPKHDWGKGLQEVSLLHLHPSPTVPGRGSRGRKLGKTQTVPGPGLWGLHWMDPSPFPPHGQPGPPRG